MSALASICARHPALQGAAVAAALTSGFVGCSADPARHGLGGAATISGEPVLAPDTQAPQVDERTAAEAVEATKAAEPSATGGERKVDASLEELAVEDENPLALVTRLQVEDNAQFGFGPDGEPLNVLRIQPIIPIDLSDDWSLILRPIVPILHQEYPVAADGLSDIAVQALLTPVRSGRFLWGLGAAFLFPSASEDVLGTGKWCAGPAAVGVYLSGPWVVGSVVSNWWSFAGARDRTDINAVTIRPIVAYNLPRGWYLSSAPTIAGNWQARSGSRWLVPLGGGVGKVFVSGSLRFGVATEAYYHVVSPKNGPDWQLRLQLTLFLPKWIADPRGGRPEPTAGPPAGGA